jgi:hypothetical protein
MDGDNVSINNGNNNNEIHWMRTTKYGDTSHWLVLIGRTNTGRRDREIRGFKTETREEESHKDGQLWLDFV